MKPEDVKISEVDTIQIKLNDKFVEKQVMLRQMAEKNVEIEKLFEEQTQAKAKDFRAAIRQAQENIAKQSGGGIVVPHINPKLNPEHN
jgi:hypothetical protein